MKQTEREELINNSFRLLKRTAYCRLCGDTWIEFPEAEGYSFFGASGGRYTLQLTFFKRV